MDFPYGTIIQPPPHFAPPEMWPEFGLLAAPVALCAREEVGVSPKGIRWSLWPLCFEAYTSDEEPSMAESRHGTLARNRLVLWKRVRRTDTPKGWVVLSRQPWRVDGLHTLQAGDYTQSWEEDARRNLRKWQQRYAGTAHHIERVAYAEYLAAYKKSGAARKASGEMVAMLGRKLQHPHLAANIELWGVRDTATGKLVAGTALVHSPTYNSSMRECPFVLEEAKHTGVVTGIMDHWFRTARERGIQTLVFTYFWNPGEPKEWKAFSQFKSRFGLEYVAYPPTLWRFMPGKIWG